MVWQAHDYDDIPGTYVFDGQRAHSSYALNKLFYSFNTEACRKEFDADPAAYCDKFGLSPEHKQLVVEQDFLGILRAGTNIYYLAKFCVPRGVTVQDAGAAFQGISGDEFRETLLKKREGLEERLAQEGGYWNG
ncbi:protocatechuate 3,4-dioxygenase [Pseudomaricurvus alkylphenolicus]|jgi:protocatechuate 4,5-dioxygenase alpha chain|uniref:protocatechuate 3,4-dioxygenase n=1 Tax=Pseudomaricurvus alkylphenolicus TaxID=1306991 RepID=UPI001420B4F2|nr:protocatechuate 3,4-dioxygenase [Pseudomaricurvus alkylphenolicus]NIB38760.1 protocatechuate 3,4-dioxygenase [Pseudomaricurvus alkylphenolicus]